MTAFDQQQPKAAVMNLSPHDLELLCSASTISQNTEDLYILMQPNEGNTRQ